MKQTTIRTVSFGLTVCAALLAGCAGTLNTSTEQRILNDYSQVSHARSSVNEKLAQGTLSQEDWRTTTDRLDAAAATLDSSMAAMNRLDMHDSEVGIAASEAILRDSVQAVK